MEAGGNPHGLSVIGSNKNGGENADKDDGSAAWQRLTDATKPLAPESRNRHIEAKSSGAPSRRSKVKKKSRDSDASKAEKAQAGLGSESGSDSGSGGGSRRAKPVATKATPQNDLLPKTRRRLARGHLPISARLDLHGLTLIEAEHALSAFVARGQTQGHSWVLVITGKGVRGEGRLRRALPNWLDRGGLAGQIVEYGPAAPKHGGDGAFYLRLRRN